MEGDQGFFCIPEVGKHSMDCSHWIVHKPSVAVVYSALCAILPTQVSHFCLQSLGGSLILGAKLTLIC